MAIFKILTTFWDTTTYFNTFWDADFKTHFEASLEKHSVFIILLEFIHIASKNNHRIRE
jgi:hypothetical protein